MVMDVQKQEDAYQVYEHTLDGGKVVDTPDMEKSKNYV